MLSFNALRKRMISSQLAWLLFTFAGHKHCCLQPAFGNYNDDSRAKNKDGLLSPREIFQQTVYLWEQNKGMDSWKPWGHFSREMIGRFEAEYPTGESKDRLEIVGALEEGILVIERIVFRQNQSDDPDRDAALSDLYMNYGKVLANLTPQECYGLAKDPYTLLIGADTVVDASSTQVCVDNAENSLRNAITLDATNLVADNLLQEVLGSNGDEAMVHKRKPKEFVEELFDSFADSFDEKLVGELSYKVPQMVGKLAETLLPPSSKYQAILDAGCGTGLAGRHLRPLLDDDTDSVMIGVDASKKMLGKARLCTLTSGCGLNKENALKDDSPLYEALVQIDLEDMTIENTLQHASRDSSFNLQNDRFDLIVAADVLVYFGSLDAVISTFAKLSYPGISKLIFTCELASEEEAPLGWRLLSSGRFAHTKQHAVQTALQHGYHLVHYEEITPRMEKGVPVKGHLFGFQIQASKTTEEL